MFITRMPPVTYPDFGLGDPFDDHVHDGALERHMIRRGEAAMPNHERRAEREHADRDLFVDLGNGALVLYRAGDPIDHRHASLPRLDAVVDERGQVVGASRRRAKKVPAAPENKADG